MNCSFPTKGAVNTEHCLLIIWVIGSLCLLPPLLAPEKESDVEGSAFLKVVESDLFRFLVVATLGTSIPMTLNHIAGALFEKQLDSSKLFTSSKFLVGFGSVVPPILYVIFSFGKKRLLTTFAISMLREITGGTILLIQFTRRKPTIYTPAIVCTTGFLFTTGTVFLAYAHAFAIPSLYILARALRIFTGACIIYAIAKHIWMLLRGRLKDDVYQWQTVVIETVTFFAVLWLCMGVFWGFNPESLYNTESLDFIGSNVRTSIVIVVVDLVLTSETAHTRILATEKLAMKRLFVRFISHEVRTPLNSCILGLNFLINQFEDATGPTAPSSSSSSSSAAASPPLSPASPSSSALVPYHRAVPFSPTEVLEALRDISRECSAAVDFMNNLLLYEKIDCLQLEMYRAREDMASVCEDIFRAFKIGAKELGVIFLCKIDSYIQSSTGEGSISACASIDRSKIIVVMRNLVSNSLKFTPKGGQVSVILSIVDSTGARMDEGSPAPRVMGDNTDQFIRLMVTDTGPGMSEEECEQLFKAFVQFSPDKLQQGGGSGIGLYLSYMIATQHGLSIEVTSRKGEGTSMYIDFPLLAPEPIMITDDDPGDDEEEKEEEGCAADLLDQTSSVDAQSNSGDHILLPTAVATAVDVNDLMAKMSILIVDDSPINRRMLIRTLRQNSIGCEIDEGCDGIELLRKLEVPVRVDSGACLPRATDSTLIPTTTAPSAAAATTATEAGSAVGSQSSSGPVSPFSLDITTVTKNYGLIIVDNHMPRMGGRKAVKILRQSGYKGLIVGHSGDVSGDDLQAFCDAGADLALPKPFQVSDLRAFLLQRIHKLRTPRTPRSSRSPRATSQRLATHINESEV